MKCSGKSEEFHLFGIVSIYAYECLGPASVFEMAPHIKPHRLVPQQINRSG